MKAQIFRDHLDRWTIIVEMYGKVYCMTYPSLDRALEWLGNTLNDGGIRVEFI